LLTVSKRMTEGEGLRHSLLRRRPARRVLNPKYRRGRKANATLTEKKSSISEL
jgi:hypothetical protein